MTNNFAEMIKAMVQAQVEQAIKEALGEMMGASPEVAKAEVVAEKPAKKTMTKEEFLSLEEEEDEKMRKKHNESLFPLDLVPDDFKPKNSKKYRHALKYNKFISNKAVWTYNHLQIKKKYPTIKYSDGHYYADSLADLKAFASSYHVVEYLNDEQFAEVKAYWDSKKK